MRTLCLGLLLLALFSCEKKPISPKLVESHVFNPPLFIDSDTSLSLFGDDRKDILIQIEKDTNSWGYFVTQVYLSGTTKSRCKIRYDRGPNACTLILQGDHILKLPDGDNHQLVCQWFEKDGSLIFNPTSGQCGVFRFAGINLDIAGETFEGYYEFNLSKDRKGLEVVARALALSSSYELKAGEN